MNNLKQELLEFCKDNIDPYVEEDSEFYGRYFLGDSDVEEFADNHNLRVFQHDDENEPEDWPKTISAIENACDCKIIYNYEGANPDRLSGDQEIIFN